MPSKSTKRPSEHELNKLRLIANEIMRQLYEAGSREQLDLLRGYAETAISDIDAKAK